MEEQILIQKVLIDEKEIIIGSLKMYFSDNSFHHLCSIRNENGTFRFEGKANEPLDSVLKRIKIAYRNHLHKKVMKTYEDLDIKTEILAVLN